MKRKNRFRVVSIGLLLFCCLATFSLGTDETVPPGTPSTESQDLAVISSLDQEIRRTIDDLRENQLLHALDLSEERARRFLETLHDARQIRQAYQIQRADIEQQLEALLQYEQPDHTKIYQVLQELQTAKAHYYQQVLQADQTLWTLLSPEEQARYILFQRHFMQQLHAMIARIRQQRAQTQSQSNFLLRRQDEESVIRQPR